MYKKLNISDILLKQSKRWSHQVDRLDKVWTAISNDDNPDKGERMRRALDMQEGRRARMGITLSVLIMGVEL